MKALVFSLAVLATSLLAGGADSPATPPPPSRPRPLQLPAIYSTSLPNGVKVEIVEDHRIPLVTLRLGVPAGSVRDAAGEEGIAAATASLLTEGTTHLSSAEIARKAATLGASVEASAGPDDLIVRGRTLSENFDEFVSLFAEIVLHPSFPESEIDIFRANALEELKLEKSQPSFLLRQRLSAILFGPHPYARIAPTEASLKSLDRQRVQTFYSRYLTPAGSVLVVYGDVSKEKGEARIRDLFSSWNTAAPPKESLPQPPSRTGPTVALVDRPGSVQAAIGTAELAPTMRSSEYFPLLEAANILGGGTASRLFLGIREKKGYTYDPSTQYQAERKDYGILGSYCTARTDVAIPAVGGIFEEMQALGSREPSAEELRHTKEYLNGTFAMSLTTQAGVSDRLLRMALLSLPPDWLKDYRDRVSAVTATAVREASRKTIDAGHPLLVVVGDAKALKAGLTKYGPVTVYDTSGNVEK
jgi:predicted Zn-dependent peptidase